ncbi:MAG TPA: hypothetical protein VID93_00770, partial [Acidimicrobiales bacterium]
MTTTVPNPVAGADGARPTEYTKRDRGLWLAGVLAAIALAVTVASLVGAGDVQLAVIPLGLVAGSG